MHTGFRPFIVGAMWLPREETLIVPGKRGGVLFKENVPNTGVLDFTQSRCGEVMRAMRASKRHYGSGRAMSACNKGCECPI